MLSSSSKSKIIQHRGYLRVEKDGASQKIETQVEVYTEVEG